MLSFIRQISVFRLNPVLYNYQSIRYISDDNVINMFKKKPVSRVVSSYDPNAKKIISALKDQDYDQVKVLVKNKNININSHDFFENTPLTDASSRGDTKAINFLVTELGANLHASCHCPYHKTALHYASENGHIECVQLLLKLGADPKLLDARKYSALDVAKDESIKKVFVSHQKETYKLLK